VENNNPYQDAQCAAEHLLEFVAEGFALCSNNNWWWAWSLTKPCLQMRWNADFIIGRNERRIPAWASDFFEAREPAEDFIREEVEARRSMPFDEATERARLMPV
jgi:hypothetical protein